MTEKPVPENLCRFFTRNPDGTWTAIQAVLVTHGQKSTGLGKGQTLAPGDIRAGLDVVRWLEKNCILD